MTLRPVTARKLWLAAPLAVALAVVAAAQTTPSPLPAAPGPPLAAPAPPPAASPPARAETVRIVFTTYPVKKAFVFWGKRRLGMIAPHAPLIVERPRDSGPLDVVVRSDGYIPVQTRAYTFGDGKVAVKLTPLDQKKTLLGYREEVPSGPDGGVPAPSGGGGGPDAGRP
jgi:hypothetical protein